jgi:hypothetical protein
MGFTKYILPVVAGVMSGVILMTFGEVRVETIYGNGGLMPDTAFMILVAMYAAGSFLAGVISTVVAQRTTAIPAVVAGITLTLAGIYNMMHLPHPKWFGIVNLVAYLPFAFAGYWVLRKKPLPS